MASTLSPREISMARNKKSRRLKRKEKLANFNARRGITPEKREELKLAARKAILKKKGVVETGWEWLMEKITGKKDASK